ncbi:MAG: ABC transporter permease subunit [Anaerolineaceae bacterium]|nr:ABC transporter permease subunit [Anaerolineaceae bacterium]
MSTSDVVRALSTPVTRQPRFRQDKYAPYFFISPFYILFAVFFLFPTIFALALGFFKWSALGEPSYFALRNYDHMFKDPLFLKAAGNTLFYGAASLLIVVPLALLEALALNSKRLILKPFWRMLYFAPIVTSSVAISLVFRLLYNTDYGFINQIIVILGGIPIKWMESPDYTKIAVMGVVIWRWTGLLAIYFLAGLQSIPEDLHEAAAIDGASGLQRFWHVTLPMLRPVMLFVSIIVVIGSLQIFDDPQILYGGTTPGGPGNSAISLVQYLYNQGIGQQLFGYASAVGVFLFAIIFVLSLVQMRVFRGND